MNNFRVGDVVWLKLFLTEERKSLLRINGIIWSERERCVVYLCVILSTVDPKLYTDDTIRIKSTLMNTDAILAEESMQLLYGHSGY